MKTWACRVDGEILLQVSGPDAEDLVRAAVDLYGGVPICREDVKPTPENGWEVFGPWVEVE